MCTKYGSLVKMSKYISKETLVYLAQTLTMKSQSLRYVHIHKNKCGEKILS